MVAAFNTVTEMRSRCGESRTASFRTRSSSAVRSWLVPRGFAHTSKTSVREGEERFAVMAPPPRCIVGFIGSSVKNSRVSGQAKGRAQPLGPFRADDTDARTYLASGR